MRTLRSPTKATTRSVACHHCRRALELPAAALTATCPACYKPLILHDLDLSANRFGGDLSTCARLIIRPKTTVRARAVIAGTGLIVLGTLEADTIETMGPVSIGAKGTLIGALATPSVSIEKGGRLNATALKLTPAA